MRSRQARGLGNPVPPPTVPTPIVGQSMLRYRSPFGSASITAVAVNAVR
jgi:hypothetical protein